MLLRFTAEIFMINHIINWNEFHVINSYTFDSIDLKTNGNLLLKQTSSSVNYNLSLSKNITDIFTIDVDLLLSGPKKKDKDLLLKASKLSR